MDSQSVRETYQETWVSTERVRIPTGVANHLETQTAKRNSPFSLGIMIRRAEEGVGDRKKKSWGLDF